MFERWSWIGPNQAQNLSQQEPAGVDHLEGVTLLQPVAHPVHHIITGLRRSKQPFALPKCPKPARPLPDARQLEQAAGMQEGLQIVCPVSHAGPTVQRPAAATMLRGVSQGVGARRMLQGGVAWACNVGVL